MTLNPEDLRVESYSTDTGAARLPGDDLNCTGCDSGCGIDPG